MSEDFEDMFGRFKQFEIDYDRIIWHKPCDVSGKQVNNLFEALKWAVEHECDRGVE